MPLDPSASSPTPESYVKNSSLDEQNVEKMPNPPRLAKIAIAEGNDLFTNVNGKRLLHFFHSMIFELIFLSCFQVVGMEM